MVLKVADKVSTFIPEFNGNKELEESKQIIIEIKHFPTVTEAKSYQNFAYGTSGSVELKYNDIMMLNACIGRIKNLEIENASGSKFEIKNGSDLASSDCLALGNLVTEIRDYILKSGELLPMGELKS